MSALAASYRAIDFELPESLEAAEPPEARGLARDQVRMLVAWRGRQATEHAIFRALPGYLDPGDLLVVNTSQTLPAAVSATGPDGAALELHFSSRLPANRWVVELRRAARPASVPYRDGRPGMAVALPGGGHAHLKAPSGTPGRLWVADIDLGGRPFDAWLSAHGRPIRYRHVAADWPLACYQTVFAREAGSAEMPSAARPFSAGVVTALVSRGIAIAPLTLHAGVSSPEAHELPSTEWFRVPGPTADLVNRTHLRRRRVIATGTTVVRALESAADDYGIVHPSTGWTDTVITADRGVRAIDGLITGWHEPDASHLAMLEAVAGRSLLDRSYREALAAGYLWHEFGDSHLILP